MAPSTSFDSMPTLASTARSAHSPPFHRRRKSWARRIERCCCTGLSYFPLVFVHGLTTWAVWAQVSVSFLEASLGGGSPSWWSFVKAVLGFTLYALGNVSYSIAVFTDPGSPLNGYNTGMTGRRKFSAEYETVPSEDFDEEQAFVPPEPPPGMSTVTAKADGKPRFCKKCRCLKPDRAHHCSTCRRCVLKMDHHCPWLATCVGLRNYKAFLLFLIYISLFCWVCFAVSASWVWGEIVDEVRVEAGYMIVNTIMLAVLGGIIGLVLSSFTGWHIYLAATGQTTIECLEKTRYLSPLRKSMEPNFDHQTIRRGDGVTEQSIGDQLKEIHANALPGILRPEEGESGRNTPLPPQGTPAMESLQRSYKSLEQDREHQRYEAYLDEVDSEKLPNAFDLGWKRNLLHLFGGSPLLWPLPICNTSGDGWRWEVSQKWEQARDDVAQERQRKQQEDAFWAQRRNVQEGGSNQSLQPPTRRADWRWTAGQGFVDIRPSTASMRVDNSNAGRDMQMQPLDRGKGSSEVYSSSSDEEFQREAGTMGSTRDWNDVPDDLLSPNARRGQRGRSRGRRKGD